MVGEKPPGIVRPPEKLVEMGGGDTFGDPDSDATCGGLTPPRPAPDDTEAGDKGTETIVLCTGLGRLSNMLVLPPLPAPALALGLGLLLPRPIGLPNALATQLEAGASTAITCSSKSSVDAKSAAALSSTVGTLESIGSVIFERGVR